MDICLRMWSSTSLIWQRPILFFQFKFWLVEMNSSAYSVGNRFSTKLSTPTARLHLTSLDKSDVSTIKLPSRNCSSQRLQLNENQTLLKRREAIGCGLCFGLIDVFRQPQPISAAEGTPPCELIVAPSGLAFCDKVVGYGPAPVKGQLIKAHYVGRLENGTVFDSSYNRGKPLTFRIGAGEVIKGWDQGILGGDGIPPMLAGGKRSLKIPPELAYGMRGAGCRGGSCIIPPDSVLLFDVEFIGKGS